MQLTKLLGRSEALVGEQMVAVEKAILGGDIDGECSECKGTGIVTYWSEITFFEDRRSCRRCDAGLHVETQIKNIINRTKVDKRLRSL
jgi:hypothetical protein